MEFFGRTLLASVSLQENFLVGIFVMEASCFTDVLGGILWVDLACCPVSGIP